MTQVFWGEGGGELLLLTVEEAGHFEFHFWRGEPVEQTGKQGGPGWVRVVLMLRYMPWGYITSHHITSRHIMSYHVMSRHVMSHHITSCHITSCHVTSGDISHVV